MNEMKTVVGMPLADRWLLDQRVKGLLAGLTELTVIDVMWYHTFARQVNKIYGRLWNTPELKPELLKLRAMWEQRGLKTHVMNLILQNIFSLGWLVGPAPEEGAGCRTSRNAK